MTSENDAKRPTRIRASRRKKVKSPLAAINDSAVAQKANQALKPSPEQQKKFRETRLLRTCCAQPFRLTTE